MELDGHLKERLDAEMCPTDWYQEGRWVWVRHPPLESPRIWHRLTECEAGKYLLAVKGDGGDDWIRNHMSRDQTRTKE